MATKCIEQWSRVSFPRELVRWYWTILELFLGTLLLRLRSQTFFESWPLSWDISHIRQQQREKSGCGLALKHISIFFVLYFWYFGLSCSVWKEIAIMLKSLFELKDNYPKINELQNKGDHEPLNQERGHRFIQHRGLFVLAKAGRKISRGGKRLISALRNLLQPNSCALRFSTSCDSCRFWTDGEGDVNVIKISIQIREWNVDSDKTRDLIVLHLRG